MGELTTYQPDGPLGPDDGHDERHWTDAYVASGEDAMTEADFYRAAEDADQDERDAEAADD